MTDNLRRSIYSGNGSSQDISQGIAEAYDQTTAEVVDSPNRQRDLVLDIQALQILDGSDDCIKLLDLDGQILFMSRGGQVLLGVQDITPFLNTSWIEFWQGADRQAAREAIAKARVGEVCTFQGYCPTPSGEPRWWDIKISPIRGTEGQVERLLCISRDITERKQAEEQSRELDERYRAIINQAVAGVACVDLSGKLTLVNQKYCDITGYSADELSQRRMQDITHPEDLPRNVELFHRMRAEGTPFEIEKRYIRKDGSIVWVNNSVSAIRDRNGKPQSAVAIVLDITERKQAALSAEFFATVTQNLAEATCVEDMIQAIGEQLNQYLQISICAFVEINESAEVAAIHHSWHEQEVPSLVGVYHLAEFVTDEFFQTAKAGRAIIVRDVTTDPQIADPERFACLKIGSFINVPLIRDNEWKFALGIYHQTPYNWRSDEIELMRELANRIWAKLERTRAETALRESEERFRLMADAVPQIVWITDADGRVEFFNKQWSNYTGVPYEPTTATEVAANFVHPNDGAVTMEAFNEARQTGSTFTVEHRIRAADGTYRWFLVRAEPYRHLETGEIIRWFGASIDIHDRKQAEAAIAADLRDTQLLRDLSARLTTETDIQVLYNEILAAAIALTQADAGTFQFFNQATQDLLLLATQGISPTLAKQFHRLNTSCITSCGIALATGERTFVDFDVPDSEDPNGLMRMHVEAGLLCAQSTPLLSRSGQPIGMVSTHWCTRHRPSDRQLRFLDLLARQAADLIEQRQDAAQRKQLLEREQAAREEAERANRIKDEFLAVLSHELRSPLNPILGWTRLLQNGKLNETRQREALATIERNAKLQTQLIEDLLDISRIIRGKLSLTVAPVNLAFVITAAVETVRLAAEAKQIQILLDLATAIGAEHHSEGIAPVSGDAARLQQVVWNLLSNAVKFTPNGGRVTVELRQIVSSGVARSANQLAQIRVIDTGKGISPDFLPHVFDYFRQADATTTRTFGGLGLGLAIVRQIVEMHGGTVQAESPGENQGATFTVRLPVMRQTPSTASEPSYAKAANQETPLSNLQILVVDDDDDTREFQAFLLEQNGARVIAVASGLEALQVLDRCIPDVLVSDVGMAQMDGYMLIQQIRSRPCERGGMIPAIALTAYAAEVDRQKALQAGFQTHITKPVDPEVLVGTIVNLLRSDR